MLFSAISKSIQNWKQKLMIWNDVSFAVISKFYNYCYVYSSFFETQIFKFVNLTLLLYDISIFWLDFGISGTSHMVVDPRQS